MTYLLDTNVISEIRSVHPDPGVAAWFAATSADELYLSVLTFGDGLLAATARVGGLTLVTRNTADLVRTSVQLLNPFEVVS